jgi:two-component system sensor histidine kinase KdpD
LSRGLVEAMSGTLSPEATPGGGLTMTISLPAVASPSRAGESAETRSIDVPSREVAKAMGGRT